MTPCEINFASIDCFSVVRESYHFLIEDVPHGIDYLLVGKHLEQVSGVLSVHDLRVWEMTPGQAALIGHVEIGDMQEWPSLLRAIRAEQPAIIIVQSQVQHLWCTQSCAFHRRRFPLPCQRRHDLYRPHRA